MKTRIDFVSNSSSCSFVLNRKDNAVQLGFKVFADTFENDTIPYDFSDKIRISARAKNKNFKKLYSFFHDGEDCQFSDWWEDYKTGKKTRKDPEELAWDSVEFEFYTIPCVISEHPEVFDIIESLSFTTDDNDMSGVFYLKLLYLFFERNWCFPDATETEHPFIDTCGSESFIGKLCSTVTKASEIEKRH